MTVPTTTSRADYLGSGSTGPFSFGFRILAASHLRVIRTSAAGVPTTLTNGIDYTVAGVGSYSGGSITLTVALAVGESLAMRRVVPLTQLTDYINQGAYYADTVEDALDLAVMMQQQQQDSIDRSIHLPEGEAGSDLLTTLPSLADRKGKQFTWDSTTGQPTAASPASAPVSAAMQPVVASATLDLAAAAFAFAATGAPTARSLRARAADVVNVKDYGAVGDGTTDDTTAIQAAITAGAGKTVFLPPGTYKITARLNVASAWTRLVGAGRDATLIAWTGGGTSYTVGAGTVSGQTGKTAILVTANYCGIEDMQIAGATVASYVANEHGVCIVGVSDASRVSRSIVRRCRIKNVGSCGINAVFAESQDYEGNEISNNGYMGISFTSCQYVRADGNHVHDITPGTASNMYGISMSHDSSLWPGDQATSPMTMDATITRNRVENIAWEGISNHGGRRHIVANNTVYNVKYPISLQTGSGGAANYSGGDHACIGNDCDGGPTYANQGFLSFSGGTSEFNTNIRIIGNSLRRLGLSDNIQGGAIRVNYGKRFQIIGNSIQDWRGQGIYIAGSGSTDFAIVGNDIAKMAAADTYGYGISLAGDFAGIRIIGNSIRTDGGTIAPRGITSQATATPVIVAGNRIEATAPTTFCPILSDGGPGGYQTITAAAGTYDVSLFGAHAVLFFNLAAPQTISNFTNGYNGQRLTIVNYSANALTIDRTNAALPGAANVVLAQKESITLVYYLGVGWYAIAPKANNG